MAANRKSKAQKKNEPLPVEEPIEEPVETVEESPQAVEETVQGQTEPQEAPQGVLEAVQDGNVDPAAVLASMGAIAEPTKKTGKKGNGQGGQRKGQRKAQDGQPKAEEPAPEWYSLETEAVLQYYDTKARLAKLNGQLAFQMKAEEEERMDEVIDGLKIAIADLEGRFKAMAEPEPHRIRSTMDEVEKAIKKVEADLKKRKAVYDGLAAIYADVEEEALARVAPQEDD